MTSKTQINNSTNLRPQQPSIIANNVKFAFNQKTAVLKGISAEFQPGSFLAILGVNGCGKSTLLECMDDIIRPQEGSIEIASNESVKNIAEYSRSERAKIISIVEQHSHANGVTVYEALLLGRMPYMKTAPTESDYEAVDAVISELDLENLAHRYMDELSGGEYQKVVIGRALVQDTPILLLDEPTNNLDMANQLEVMELLRETALERGIAVVAVMHDINLALRYCDRFLMMRDGCLLACGGLEVMTKENIEATYGVSVEIIKHGNTNLVVPDERGVVHG